MPTDMLRRLTSCRVIIMIMIMINTALRTNSNVRQRSGAAKRLVTKTTIATKQRSLVELCDGSYTTAI